MKKAENQNSNFFNFLKVRHFPFFTENGKSISRFIFTAFFIGIGIWFVKHEQAEILEVKNTLKNANIQWVFIGLILTALYILFQGLMYVASFASIKTKLSISEAIILFLKRNFISVFLPAGGISSLAFFTKDIKKKGIKEVQIYLASSIYAFIGILSVVIIAIPAFIYALAKATVGISEWLALLALIILTVCLILIYRSLLNKTNVYRWTIKKFPKAELILEDLQNNKIDKNNFIRVLIFSLIIELLGIAHVYVAMLALNILPSLLAAIMAYTIAVIFLIISPFLRGLGAIEVSMTFILIQFGFGNIEAIAITFLYRFFEFWTPFFAGVISFLLKINKLLMRIVPALFLFSLGIINCISVLTPAISQRLSILRDFVPVEAITTSNYLVLSAGLFLLITAAFMLKGLRTAWYFAMLLAFLSFIGHLTKGIDFEESFLALIVILILLITRKEYYVKNNPKLRLIGLQTALLSIAAVLIYGVIGFFFLDKKHFNIDFSGIQSVKYTLQNYFLLGSEDLIPLDEFAANFLASIRISGFLSISFLFYTLIRPYIFKYKVSEEEIAAAKRLLEEYGDSSLDYFKTYFDKLLFFSKNKKAFLAYRIAENFAVVLENPVAENAKERINCVKEFDRFCYQNGLRCLYYRIPEKDIATYKHLRKKSLFLGQEGIVNLETFSLEGGSKKALRNSLNKITDKGLKVRIHNSPIKEGLLQKLNAVSAEWLSDTNRKEIIFSQGMFLWDELRNQTIITVENEEEKIIAFLNIIPDYKKGEATYDLIRKMKGAPGGIMDYMMVELFNYLKSKNINAVNIGLAPLSGIDDPNTFSETSMKFAYEKIKTFSHYKGLRDFKDKFDPQWENQYLIYSNDYDLFQMPRILKKIIKV